MHAPHSVRQSSSATTIGVALASYRHPCDTTGILEAHHITNRNEMPNGGYVVENGITLCPKHHRQVEGEGVKARHSLYVMLGSTEEGARKAAERL
jgi:hypothetical protein